MTEEQLAALFISCGQVISYFFELIDIEFYILAKERVVADS